MPTKRKAPTPNNTDIRVLAAENWKERHGLKKTHDAFTDVNFRQAFNRYIKNPTDKNRKALGLRSGGQRERKELHLIKTLKEFGDTP